MSVRSGQSVTVVFTTTAFATGVATNATGTPTGTLYVNGTSDAASVTVTNITTGLYKAAVTLPTLAIGDEAQLVINATISAVTNNFIIWGDTKDVDLSSTGGVTLADGVALGWAVPLRPGDGERMKQLLVLLIMVLPAASEAAPLPAKFWPGGSHYGPQVGDNYHMSSGRYEGMWCEVIMKWESPDPIYRLPGGPSMWLVQARTRPEHSGSSTSPLVVHQKELMRWKKQ